VPETLSWITSTAGAYRLLVKAHDPRAARGSYTLALEEVRPAVAGDETRVAMERAADDARQRSYCEKEEDKRAALRDLEKVLSAWQAAGDRLQEAVSWNDIGDLQVRLGDNDASLDSLHRALDLAKALNDAREQARALDKLGIVHHRKADKADVVMGFYSESLRLWRLLGDRAGEAVVLFDLGVLCSDSGDAAQALDYYEQSLELRRTKGSLADQALTLAGIGLVHRNRGDAALALDFFTRGLDLARRSGDRSAEAFLLYSTASFHLHRGELQPAIELFTASLDLYQMEGDLSQEAWLLTSLGSANVSLGDLDRALDCYQRALEIQRGAKGRVGELYALLFIGWVQQLQGNTEAALESYSQALQIGRSAANPLGLGRALYFLGRIDLRLNRADAAAGLLQEALANFKDQGSVMDEARTLIELGRAAHALGDDEQAEQHLQRALDLGRSLQNFIVQTDAQGALARLDLDRGDLPAARSAIEEALRTVDSVRSKVASQRLRILFLASRQAFYEMHLDILMRLHERDPAGSFLPAALAASEQARARGLLDLLAEGRIDVRQGVAADLKQREEEIDNRISVLQTQMLDDVARGGWDAAKAAVLEDGLKQAEDDREKLEWEIRRRHPRYAAVRSSTPLSLAEIQALLDERSALLEYTVGEERSFLFVVTRQGLSSYVLPPKARLADEVRRLGDLLQKPGRRSLGLYRELAGGLYRELVSPAAGVLAQKPHLIVSPDGPLQLLSFEALLTGEAAGGQGFQDLPYLIREKSVTYVPSASVLAELAMPREPREPRERPETAEAPKRFVGFADPIPMVAAAQTTNPLRAAPGGLPPLPRLLESRREVTGIAGLYPPGESQLFLDGAATEENVKDNPLLRTARRIHFATHGFLDEKRPELSGLVLSRGAGSREDGLLQVYEIFNLELDADLVVLSACDTGLGAMVSGEGLVGVTRALLYAGARSVVVSLWQVDDDSTPDLMISFYRHLDQDADKAESLRQAKLEMIRQGRFSHPFYWAPFILLGEPR
jgi:CHAT domain-containing protein